MLKVCFLMSLFFLVNANDCDPQKQEARITSLEAEVNQLKAEVVELKQKPVEHHYELRSEGFRTFRFDPTTGDTCIQLTSAADWKRKETKQQSCECTDASAHYVALPTSTDVDQKAAQDYFNFFVKSACGA